MPRILCILALLLAFCAAPAFAQQLVGATISTDTEVTETQYVDSSNITTTINSGATLTIRVTGGTGIVVTVPSVGPLAPNLEFTGGGTGHLVITGATGSGIFSDFSDSGESSILDFTGLASAAFIDNTATNDYGGAIRSSANGDSTVTLGDEATFSGNTATGNNNNTTDTSGYGGAIYSYSDKGDSTVMLGDRAVFSNNTADMAGGAIYSYSDEGDSTVRLGNEATFSGNADYNGNGGAIYSYSNEGNSTVTLEARAVFSNNTADKAGGAIFSYSNDGDSTVTLGDGAVFSNNTAVQDSGGAIFSTNEDGKSTVTLGPGAVFSRNTAGNAGGAIAILLKRAGTLTGNSELNISGNSLFQGNMATSGGGAIYLEALENRDLSLNLGAATLGGDIVFKDNRHRGTTPNSVYLETDDGGAASININGDGNVYFDDPIDAYSATSTADHSLTKDGTGFVQFSGENGENRLNPTSASNTGRVDIKAGTFRLAGGDAKFHAYVPTFTVAGGATLAGGGEIVSTKFVFSPSGPNSAIISPDSDTLAAPDILDGSANPTVAANNRVGTLVLDGDVELNGLTLDIDMMKDANNAVTADKIEVTGAIDQKAGTYTLNLGSFVGDVSSLVIMTATSGINHTAYNTANITVGGMALVAGSRMAGAVTLNDDNSGGGNATELWLTTADIPNEKITWQDDAGLNWNFTAGNWHETGGGDPISFAANDYVTFDTVGLSNDTVNLGNNTALVSGMKVADGPYTFQNGSIVGRKGTFYSLSSLDLDPDTEDGILLVNSGGAATFDKLHVDFEGGLLLGYAGSKGTALFQKGATLADSTNVTFGHDGSELTFDMASADFTNGYAYAGKISGQGTLEKTGDGALTLAGDKSDFTGHALVSNGELRLSNPKALGGAEVKLLGPGFGNLRLSFGANEEFANLITSDNTNSQLIIDSRGHDVITTISNPNNNFQGDTTVARGLLAMATTGSLAPSTVTVESGAGLVAGTGGFIGDLLMQTGSTLWLSSSEAGALNADAAAFESGVLKNAGLASNTWQPGKTYEMLTVTNKTGENNVTGTVGTNTIQGELFWGDGIATDLDTLYFSAKSTTPLENYVLKHPNPRAAARGVDSTDHTGPLFSYFDHLDQAWLQEAFYQAAGVGHATLKTALVDGADGLGTDVLDQLHRSADDGEAAASAGDFTGKAAGHNLWFALGGQWQEIEGQAGNSGEASWKGPEATLGYTWRGLDGWSFGGAFQFSAQEFDEDHGRHQADFDRLSLSPYLARTFRAGGGDLRLSGGLAYSRYQIDSTRNLRLPDLRERHQVSYDAEAWSFFTEAAWARNINENLSLEPFLALSYTHLSVDGFQESGGLTALTGRASDSDHVGATLGSRGLPLRSANACCLRPNWPGNTTSAT